MDIRACVQEALNSLPEDYRINLFNQIVALRKMADHEPRVIQAVSDARAWNESARLSDDPDHWDYCLSCVYCLFAAAFEPISVKAALHWARSESSAMAWRHSRDWDKSEDAYYKVH